MSTTTSDHGSTALGRPPARAADHTASRHRHRPAATLTKAERGGARLAGLALLAMVVVSLPAAAMLDTADATGTRLAVGTAFAVVAGLDVVVGWGLYVLLHSRAHPPAYAALVSRAGYAVLLAASAARLLWPGGDGVDGFHEDWSLALVVFGLHLVVAAVAVRRARVAPLAVVVATGAAGAAYLLDEALTRIADVPWQGVLVPFMLGELVLMAWLLALGRRPHRPRTGAGRPGPAT